MWISDNIPTSAQKPVLTPGANRVNPLLPIAPVGDTIKVWVSRQLDRNVYELLYNGRRLTTLSDNRLTVGQSYSLRVEGRDEQGRLITTVASRLSAGIDHALQLRLPQQQDPASLLAALYSRAQAGSLPPALSAAIMALPQRSDVTEPRRLNERIIRSGLFFEALLSGGYPAANSDLKALLLRLRSWLQGQPAEEAASDKSPARSADSPQTRGAVPKAYQGSHLYQPFSFTSRNMTDPELPGTPRQWLRATEGALARIESQQLIALHAREMGHILTLIDLPVYNQNRFDMWRMAVEDRPGSDRDESEPAWQLTISVALPSAGNIAVRLYHRSGETRITFYPDDDSVYRLIETRLASLGRKLNDAGLLGVTLTARKGPLPDSEQPQVPYPTVNTSA